MINLTRSGFKRSFDVDEMLYEDMVWLTEQVRVNVGEFEEVATQMSLRQEDWDKFWKKIRTIKEATQREFTIECVVLGREWQLTQEEFEFVKQLLGEPQELSNCCGSEVYPHNTNDHTSRCVDCKEGCGVVYFWSK